MGLGGKLALKGCTKKCKGCETATGRFVFLLEHQCVEFLISIGKDPKGYEHSKLKFNERVYSTMTREEASAILAKKLSPFQADKKKEAEVMIFFIYIWH